MAAKLKSYFQLHLIVFIWGFTAVLGKLISIEALPLVWYRMLIASILIVLFILIKKYPLKVSKKTFLQLVVGGIALAMHWYTFFLAIKVSNVSITLATMSTGALFTALLEPIWYKRKVKGYELVFGLIVVLGLFLIFKVETKYGYGMLIAMLSAFLSVVFTLINGKLVQHEKPTVISCYELIIGVSLISVLILFQNGFSYDFFQLKYSDWFFIFVLASICTAYAFIVGVRVMKHISPYTVVLTVNLEPVYGILLAFIILGDDERMNPMFYFGAIVIIATVVANGVIKNRVRPKKNKGT